MFGFLKNIYTEITDIISGTSAEKSTSRAEQISFLLTAIKNFESSPERLIMDTAERYYENKNDILEAKRYVIGRDPETQAAVLMESKVLSNNKLNHNFMKKLTRQKIGYMLGKPFTFTAITAEEEDRCKALFTAINQVYFKKDFFKMIKNVGRDSIVKGIGWLLVYYNEVGELKFKRISPEEVIPIWADNDHTVLDAVIRKYVIRSYVDGKVKDSTFVDYYTRQGVYKYQYNEMGTISPLNGGLPVAHFSREVMEGTTKKIEGVNWNKIPFIPFKYDPDEQSLLVRIKDLVDDYDKKTSGVSNSIDDFPNSLIVVKNYDGASKEEFTHNKNQYRSIFVQGDGDAKVLETPLNVEEVDKHIQRLREDIYEFGQGVNTADKDIRDTSGVALRFMYADLDMDCLDWGSEFKWSIMELVWFLQQDIIAKDGEDYTDVEYDIVFNTDVIINETETIQNCFTSIGVISDETIAANHPWTLDAKKEVAAKLEMTEEELKLEKQYAQKPTTSPASGQRTSSK